MLNVFNLHYYYMYTDGFANVMPKTSQNLVLKGTITINIIILFYFVPLIFTSLWDRVIGGSCMILVYVAVAILLSFKRKIFGFTSAERLKYFLDNVSCGM